jgi:hypothetical protein|tara:strand:- start:3426 stop:3698 length:273 start_codon:yes stop_codon:yes gene_type:complete
MQPESLLVFVFNLFSQNFNYRRNTMTDINVVYGLMRDGKIIAMDDGTVTFTTPEKALEAKKTLNFEESKGVSTKVQAFTLSRTVVAGGSL